MKKISIILVNYNKYQDTIECINSIYENEKNLDYQIIVVDNNSTNNSLEELSKIPNIVLIASKKNGGFSYGNNLGIKYAIEKKSEYVLLLNNDTIITKDSISKLVNYLEKNKEVTLISSRIMSYYDKNIINSIGGRINWIKCIGEWERRNIVYKELENNFQEKEIVTGCCMLFKTSLIDDIGFLDDIYFMYYEDIDFCVRLKNKGYKLGVLMNSVIYHKESASSGGSENVFSIRWNTRNRMIFINRYSKNKLFSYLFFYVTRILVIFKYIIKEKSLKKVNALLEGVRDGRKYIKKNKRK